VRAKRQRGDVARACFFCVGIVLFPSVFIVVVEEEGEQTIEKKEHRRKEAFINSVVYCFLCFNLVYIDCTELKPKVRWFVLVVCFVGRRRCRRVVKQDRFQTDKKKHTTTETVLVLSLLKKTHQ